MTTLYKLIEQMRNEQQKRKDFLKTAFSQITPFNETIKLSTSDFLNQNKKYKEFLKTSFISDILGQAVEAGKLKPMINKKLHSLSYIPPINSPSKNIEIEIEVIKESDGIDVIIYEEDEKIIVNVKKSDK